MGKKAEFKKKRGEPELTAEESMELQMILDRLSVQVPNGESFQVYLESLGKLLDKRERLVAALLSQLSKKPSPVGFRTYQALEGLVSDRSLRKILRQAAYRFSQKGFSLMEEEEAQERVILVQKEQKKAASHLVLGSGTLWLLTALVPDEAGGWPAGVLAFFEEGFHRLVVRVTETSNRAYRELVGKFSEAAPRGRPCEIPIWHAARLFFEMVDFSEDPNPPPDMEEARRLLAPYFEPGRPPFVYEVMPPVDEEKSGLRDVNVDDLLDAMDVSWLIFPREDLIPFHRRMEDLVHSILVVSDQIREEQYQAIITDAVDSLCTGKRRLLFRRFFEEQALWLKTQGNERLAKEAMLTALNLTSDARFSANPVVRHVMVQSLHHHWPEAEQIDEQKERPEPFYRTDSGLLIPR